MNGLDEEGYPTEEYLQFIRDYEPTKLPIMEMVSIICENWYYGDWGWRLKRKYRGIRKLELHTGGWSGNEDIIAAIKSNIYLTHFTMRHVAWETGGHFYFEITVRSGPSE
jgi:hypothetical protein